MSNEPQTVELTRAVEDFLKAVFILQARDERVSTNDLADMLQRTQPTVTDMAQRLMVGGLIDYQKYKGVTLTHAGQEIALKIVRRHRLIELYLVRELGYPLAEVHERRKTWNMPSPTASSRRWRGGSMTRSLTRMATSSPPPMARWRSASSCR